MANHLVLVSSVIETYSVLETSAIPFIEYMDVQKHTKLIQSAWAQYKSHVPWVVGFKRYGHTVTNANYLTSLLFQAFLGTKHTHAV